MAKNTVRHVLLELERAGWDALCNQTGSEYYGELMLPNALMVLANGIAMDRDMVVSALSESPPYLRWCAGILLCMTVPARSAAQEAAAVTQTALALAGHELDPFTREVTDKMGRGELTGDEAVEAIIAHFAGRSQPV